MIRRADLKKEIKEVRNQGIVWGVIVAPLGTGLSSSSSMTSWLVA